jgi:hypothetical protein
MFPEAKHFTREPEREKSRGTAAFASHRRSEIIRIRLGVVNQKHSTPNHKIASKDNTARWVGNN